MAARKKKHCHWGKWMFGLVIVLVGGVLIAAQIGILPGIENALGILWALLIIFVGLSLIDSETWISSLATISATIVVLLLLSIVLVLGQGRPVQERVVIIEKNDSQFFAVDALAQVDLSIVEIDIAGPLFVSHGSMHLVDVRSEAEDMNVSTGLNQSIQRSRIEADSHDEVFVNISEETTSQLSIDHDAFSGVINLRELQLESFYLETTVSDGEVIFGDDVALTASIVAREGMLELNLPASASVSLTVLSQEPPEEIEGFDRSGNIFTSTADPMVEHSISITIEGSQLDLQVDWY